MRGTRDVTEDAVSRALGELGWSGCTVEVASQFGKRLLGMTVRAPRMPDGKLLVMAFPDCHAVHTCFMRYPLDIAFVRVDGTVVEVHEGVVPWRSLACPSASMVLERASCLTEAPNKARGGMCPTACG